MKAICHKLHIDTILRANGERINRGGIMSNGLSRFSNRTIVEVMPILFEGLTHDDIDVFLLSFGLHNIAPQEKQDKPGEFFSKEKRARALSRYLIDNPDEKGPNGSNMTFEIFEYILEKMPEKLSTDRQVISSLKRDGYIIENGQIRTALPEEIKLPEKENALIKLLIKYKFATPKGHLDQAISAHARGDWAAANSQLRSFVESLFNSLAENIAKDKGKVLQGSSHEKREFLANENFFRVDLNEWNLGGNQCAFVQGFWKRLHSQGSHPGLSAEDDCTFRLHLVLLTTFYFLERFDHVKQGLASI